MTAHRFEMILVDARLPEIDRLLEGLDSGISVRRVEGDEDGAVVLSEALGSGALAVHVVAHGQPGHIALGRGIDAAALVDAGTRTDADLFVHSCRAAAGDAGRALVERLAALTRGVAAASGVVGSPARGGSWALDVAAGLPVASPAFTGASTAWAHTLDTLTGTSGNDTLTGGAGADTLTGSGGDDSLVGGDGYDVAVFTGNSADYTITATQVTDSVSGRDGTDTLSGIDELVFADGSVVLNANAPTAPTDGDSAADTVQGGAATGTAVGITAIATDADPGSTIAFTLDDNAGGRFAIDTATGVVTVADGSLLDASAANSHQIIVRASDGSRSSTATFTIAVQGPADNPPSAPSDADSTANAVPEGAATGTLVGITAQSTDPEAAGAVTFNLTDDAGGRFAIDATSGVVTVADGTLLDYETASSHIIIVKATDANGLSSSTSFTIAVGDLPDVRTYTGTTGADAFTATAGDVWTIRGGGGNDTLTGGDRDDLFQVSGSADGYDAVDGGAGADTIVALADNTVIGLTSLANVETITNGGYAGVTVSGDGAANTLDLTSVTLDGITLVRGGAGDDRLTGSAGADTLAGDGGNDTLNGGAGDDLFLVTGSGDGFDAVNGGAGTDTIRATTDGTVIGLTALSGIEAIDAGGCTGVTISGDGANNALNFSAVTLTGITRIDGGAGNDTLTGSAGSDSIDGGTGNDSLDGGLGADTLVGGSGNDTFVVDDAGDVVVELAAGGSDTVRTTLSVYMLAAEVETLLYIGSGSFRGTGNTLANKLTGGSGNDTLSGAAGDDTLNGGAGADSLAGGTGNDVYIVDNVGDTVTELAGEGVDEERTTLSSLTLGAEVENLTYTGSGAFSGVGNTLGNRIQGGAGADTLEGGAGADTLEGGTGLDTASYAGSAAAVSVNLGTGVVAGGDALGDVLIGIENVSGSVGADTLTGDAAANALGGAGGDDTLSGAAGNDTLTGGAGNDSLDGGTGNDSMLGGTGNDTYVVDAEADAVVELVGEGIDTIRTALTAYTLGAEVENLTFTGTGDFTGTGNAHDNVLLGGAGADTLDGGLGADTLDGAAGIDVASYASASAAVTVNLATGTHTGDAAGDKYLNIETFAGSAFADSFTGDAGNNWFMGGAGNDTLDGGGGNDTLDGGAGNDSLTGGLGDDIYIVDSASDVVVETAGAGTDTIRTKLNSMTLSANVESLVFTGTGAFAGTGNGLNNYIAGQSGDDTLIGGAGNDTFEGGLGYDTVSYLTASSGVTVNLATGMHTGDAAGDVYSSIEIIAGSNSVDTLIGDAGNNWFQGGLGDDNLQGGAGDDTLDGGGGAGRDYMTGGAGNDVYYVDTSLDVITENLNEGIDSILTTVTIYTLAANVENLTFTGTAAFSGTGNTSNNRITGGGGNDTLAGGAGADTLDGGDGFDIASYANASAAITLNFATGTATGDAAGDKFSGIEAFRATGYADSLTGDDGNNWFQALGGNDTLTGGLGADTLDGGLGTDTAVYSASAGGVAVNLSTGLGAQNDANGDVLISIENVIGSGYADALTGNGEANLLDGGAGDDTLDGGTGSDAMVGGAGNDIYYVDTSLDVITENLNEGIDSILTTVTIYTLGANVENLTFTGTAAFNGTGNTSNNRITGGGGNDTLAGGAGADTLDGGAGADTLVGGAGADYLVGGTGADLFVFQSLADSATDTDSIQDFSVAQGDSFDLFSVDANSNMAGDQAFIFIGADSFTGAAGQLRCATGADTWLLGDVNGDGTADFGILLSGSVTLTAASFSRL